METDRGASAVTSNHDDEMTSKDYYFDSYSHFGEFHFRK